MKTLARTILLFMLAAAVAAPAVAQETKKERKKGARKARRTVVYPFRLPRAVTATLTADQKTKLEAITKEYRPKLLEIRKQQETILTADQKAKLEKAVAGKKGRERAAAQRAARRSITLSSDQKKKQSDLAKQERTLRNEINKKVDSVLTDEQKELRKKSSKRKGGRKNRKKNADA